MTRRAFDPRCMPAHLISPSDPSIAGLTAYDAVQRLRPGFFIDRTAGRARASTPIQVSVNGGRVWGQGAFGVRVGCVWGQSGARFGVRLKVQGGG